MTEIVKESQSIGWMFTINNPVDDEFQNIKYQYMIWQLEVGETTGTVHVQGYVVFKSRKRFSTVKDLFPDGTHLEVRRGKHSEAKGYCSKKETRIDGPWEYGDDKDVPEGQGFRSDMLEIRNKIDDGLTEKVIWQENFSSYSRYFRAFRTYREITKTKPKDTDEQMEWWYGETGTGKSWTAREQNPNAYIKMCNKWWDNYNEEEVVILDDFDYEHKYLCHLLKIWADRYAFEAETKGSVILIRPKKIIVTSNWHPREIWDNEKDLNPIIRRFKITRFAYLKNKSN